jgi:hypothetical protein
MFASKIRSVFDKKQYLFCSYQSIASDDASDVPAMTPVTTPLITLAMTPAMYPAISPESR